MEAEKKSLKNIISFIILISQKKENVALYYGITTSNPSSATYNLQ